MMEKTAVQTPKKKKTQLVAVEMIQIPEKKKLVAAAGMAAEASRATWQQLWGGERQRWALPALRGCRQRAVAPLGAIAFAARLFCRWVHAADPQQSLRAPAGHKDTHKSKRGQDGSRGNHGQAGSSLLGQSDSLSLLRDFCFNKFPFGYYKAEIRSWTMKKETTPGHVSSQHPVPGTILSEPDPPSHTKHLLGNCSDSFNLS